MSRLDELLAVNKPPAQPCDYVIVRSLLPPEEQDTLDSWVYQADPRVLHASDISRLVAKFGDEIGVPLRLTAGVIGRHRRNDCLFCTEKRTDSGGRNARGKAR